MALAAGTARGGAPGGPGVWVEARSGSLFISPAQIAAARDVVPSRDYTLRVHPGEVGQVVAHSGLSVRGLIELAGFDPDAFGFLTVPRADGTTAYLPASYFAEPPPFPEGPAIVSVDANSTHFFRPVLGPDDANAADNIASPGGVALTLGVHAGPLLEVHASASRTEAEAGQEVAFSATVSGAPAGERIGLAWSFGDGAAAAGAEASHSFSGSGTYSVIVTATGEADSGGASEPISVVVGDPPRLGGEGSSPTPRQVKGTTANGNDGGPGTGNGAGSGDGAGSGAGGGEEPGSGDRRRPSGATGPANEAQAATAEASSSSPGRAVPESSSEARREPAAATSSAGERVEGILVSSPPPASAVAAEAGSHPSVAAASAAGASAGVPIVALGIAAALGAGALLEIRRRPARAR